MNLEGNVADLWIVVALAALVEDRTVEEEAALGRVRAVLAAFDERYPS